MSQLLGEKDIGKNNDHEDAVIRENCSTKRQDCSRNKSSDKKGLPKNKRNKRSGGEDDVFGKPTTTPKPRRSKRLRVQSDTEIEVRQTYSVSQITHFL